MDTNQFSTANIDTTTTLKIGTNKMLQIKIVTKLEEFQERDSGWALFELLQLKVNINNPFEYK